MKIIINILLFAFSICVFMVVRNHSQRLNSLEAEYAVQVAELKTELHKTQATLDSLVAINVQKTIKRKNKSSAEVSVVEGIIYKTLIEQCVDSSMAKTIVAIAKHESNNFNSKLFRDTNNLFGMTFPPRRNTYATGHAIYLDNGNVRRFCKFESVEDATRDFVLYLHHWKYSLDLESPDVMVRTMKSKRYFEANEGLYLRAVKRHLEQLSI